MSWFSSMFGENDAQRIGRALLECVKATSKRVDVLEKQLEDGQGSDAIGHLSLAALDLKARVEALEAAK